MNTKLKGDVVFAYVFGGISNKSNKPYLQVSDGIEAKFVNLSKDLAITPDTFAEYERGDAINLEIEVEPLAGRVTVLSIIK